HNSQTSKYKSTRRVSPIFFEPAFTFFCSPPYTWFHLRSESEPLGTEASKPKKQSANRNRSASLITFRCQIRRARHRTLSFCVALRSSPARPTSVIIAITAVRQLHCRSRLACMGRPSRLPPQARTDL